MNARFAAWILKKAGWERIGSYAPEQNVVILEAPHTSVMDFVIGYLYYESMGKHLKVMVKKEFFRGPLGPLLRALGCFPIDRKSPTQTILSVIHELEHNKDGYCHMVMCPEGTRKAISRWKTGYHIIAKGAGVPVYLSMIDWGHKRVGIFSKFELTDNAREDTKRLQGIYGAMDIKARHPKGFVTE